MKKLLLTLFFLLCGASYGEAQGILYQISPPAPNAQVLVCPSPDNGYPCPVQAAIFSNVTLTTAIAQPVSLGSSGFFSFYIAAGTYTIQLTGPGYNASNRQIVTIGSSGGGSYATGQNPVTNAFFAADPSFNLPKSARVSWGTGLTITNGSPTVTCTGVNCTAWAQSDVGAHFIFTNGCCSSTAGAGGSSLVVAGTTILSVQSATSITLSANATGSCTSSIQCISVWGTKSTTALTSWWNSVTGGFGCGTGILPVGLYIVDGAVGNTSSTNCGNSLVSFPQFTSEALGGNNAYGQGSGATVFVKSNDFSYTGCTGGQTSTGCFFGGTVQGVIEKIGFWGAGDGQIGQTHGNAVVAPGVSSTARDVRVVNWGGSEANNTGLIGLACNANCVEVTSYDAGYTSCQLNSPFGANATLRNSYCGNSKGFSLQINTSGTVLTDGNDFGQTVSAATITWGVGGTWISHGDYVYGNPPSAPNALIFMSPPSGQTQTLYTRDSSFMNCTGTCAGNALDGLYMNPQTGGVSTVHATGTAFAGSTSGFAVGFIAGGGTKNFFDECGNTFTGPTTVSNGNYFGSCSSTGTTQTASNITPTSNFGTGCSTAGQCISAVTGTAALEQFTVTYGTGPASPQVITIVWPTPQFPTGSVPLCRMTDVGGTNAFPTSIVTTTCTATGASFTIANTPIAANTVTFQVSAGIP